MNTKNKKTTKSIVLNKGNLNKKEELSLTNPIYNRANFKEFCELETDWNIKSVKKEDLLGELTDETCEFIDLFRRKTANEKTEWNFYIDYEKNEIIHCFHGQETKVRDWIHYGLMENRNIISIHNHPKGTYSAPSPQNFEILKHEFEDYEIICAEKEYWIIKAKGYFKNRKLIQEGIFEIFQLLKNLIIPAKTNLMQIS